ncbi:MAG: hypothetical protein ACYDDQ_03680 [Vulcanimicrobiaceae bacterium]
MKGAPASVNRRRIWLRCIAVALVFSGAAGFGLYSVAPDGHFQIGPGMPSHDFHKYAWFFQGSIGWWFLLLEEGLMCGSLFFLPFAIPLAVVVAAALSLIKSLRPLAVCLVGIRPLLLFSLAVLIGWIVGLAITISSGVFPGICC